MEKHQIEPQIKVNIENIKKLQSGKLPEKWEENKELIISTCIRFLEKEVKGFQEDLRKCAS